MSTISAGLHAGEYMILLFAPRYPAPIFPYYKNIDTYPAQSLHAGIFTRGAYLSEMLNLTPKIGKMRIISAILWITSPKSVTFVVVATFRRGRAGEDRVSLVRIITIILDTLLSDYVVIPPF